MRAKQGWPFSWNPGGLTAEKREQLDVLPSLLLPTAHTEVSGFPVSWSLGNSGIFNYQPGHTGRGMGSVASRDPCQEMEPQGASKKEACGPEVRGGWPGRACSEAGAGGQGPCCPQRALGELPISSPAETWGSSLRSVCLVPPQGMDPY